MIRRPPRPTLFPYTTLSQSDVRLRPAGGPAPDPPRARRPRCRPRRRAAAGARSEENTSELQSRQYLVCRLLLEKKKKANRCVVCYIVMSHVCTYVTSTYLSI